jgi:hypothetical protein
VTWLDDILAILEAEPVCGYVPGQSPATEPTAMIALALHGHGRAAAARVAAGKLVDWQAENGSLGVRPDQAEPGWPTALAVLAWIAIDREHHAPQIQRACEWIVSQHGKSLERSPVMGHDTTLDGWPWAAGTHSWLEPTAFCLLALKAAGMGEHPRTREGVRLLIDRQLPAGGCNYGNTIVLGQTLRAHVEPTGVAMLALAGETDASGRMTKSLAWLKRSISEATTATSLAWALQGLAAHGQSVSTADTWLAAAAGRIARKDQSAHKQALLAIAALGDTSPLATLGK